METKYFTNLQRALDYAQSIGIDTYSRENQVNIRDNGAVLTTLGQKVGFDIDGFCEVVPNIYVFDYIQMDGTRIQEIRFRGHLLHIFETDAYYFISNMDKGKYGLSPCCFIDTNYNTFRYFKTGLVAPQNIGKATKTKVLNWAEYADSLEREKLTYWRERKDRRERVLESIKAKYPSAPIRTIGKAFNWYDFEGYEVTIEPKGSAIRIKYELDGCGSIGTSYSVNYTEAFELSKSILGE